MILGQHLPSSRVVNCSAAKCYTHSCAPDRGKLVTLVADNLVSGVVCSRETDDEVFMTRSLNVTPRTTEQHLIVRTGKSEAEVTIIKYYAKGIVLLKLTTDGHKTSCGLSATAKLLVCCSCMLA